MSVVWPFKINWRNGLTDQREYRTEILLSRSGKEQRRALRTTPRRSIEFTAQVSGERLRSMNRLMARWQNKTLLMPDWVTYATLAEPLAVNATDATLTADAPDWLTAGVDVIFFSDDIQESRIVESVAGNAITFVSGGAAWPAGAQVYRALTGLLGGEISGSLPSSNVMTVPVVFNVAPTSLAAESPSAAAVTLDGYEVFTRTPNWGEAVQSVFTFPLSTVDYGRGRIENYRPVDFGTTTRRGTFYGLNREGVDDLVASFTRAKGRRGEFYFATQLSDLDLRTTWAANNAQMRVVGLAASDSYADELVHRGVAIYLLSGAVYYRQVTGITTITDGLGSDSVLQLDAGVPVNLEPADILRISWLPRHRFGSDSLTINWLTDSVGELAMSFVSLESLQGN